MSQQIVNHPIVISNGAVITSISYKFYVFKINILIFDSKYNSPQEY